MVRAATNESSVHVSRKRGWYGWSWNVTRSSPACVGERGQRDDLLAAPGRRGDEDAELEGVAVVAHGRNVLNLRRATPQPGRCTQQSSSCRAGQSGCGAKRAPPAASNASSAALRARPPL